MEHSFEPIVDTSTILDAQQCISNTAYAPQVNSVEIAVAEQLDAYKVDVDAIALELKVDKHELNTFVRKIRVEYQAQLKILEGKYKIDYETFNKEWSGHN